MSQADYDALVEHVAQIKKILSRAVVVKDAQPETTVASNVTPVVKMDNVHQVADENLVVPYVKEELTDYKMQNLFAANYRGILYYNFDTKSWNTNRYQGAEYIDADMFGRKAGHLKEFLENMPEFKNLELVAYVTMLNNSDYFPGWCESIEKPVFSRQGKSVLANIVCRSRKSGRILPVSNSWIGVKACPDNVTAVHFCYDATSVAITRSVLRDTLVNNFIKNR